MISASAHGRESRALPMSQTPPIVFIVDDDVSVRESLELLLRHEGLGVETFVSAQEFLGRPRADVPSCMVLDYFSSRTQRSRSAEAYCGGTA